MDGEPGRADPSATAGVTSADAVPQGVPAYTYGPTFGPRQTRRRSPAGWIIGAVLAVAVVAAGAVVHVVANRAFDEAAGAAAAASSVLSTADASVGAASADAAAAGSAAEGITVSAAGDLSGPDELAAFTEAAALVADAAESADALLAASAPGADPEKPTWTWELFGAVPGLERATASRLDDADRLDGAAAAVDEALEVLAARAADLFATVPAVADALEAANVSATTAAVLDFRDAAAAASGQTRVSMAAAGAFERYAQAARDLAASAAAELAEKQGPLYDTRLEIEEYARSISGGVVLDFDWAPVVNGIGGASGMAGTATWNTARGGFSTITLSDSVAANWPAVDARALVTHEVGHSITAKCSDLFDSADADANEQWATAWAISMGFTTPGNGTQAYGYPPQEMIDAAATCR